MKSIIGLLICISLVGCASTGPMYKDSRASNSLEETSCRLIVYRTPQSQQYILRSASVKIDDLSIGKSSYNGYKVFTTTPGNHRITVDMWDAPGKCSLPFSCSKGETLFFQVEPRTNNLLATSLGGAIGSAIEAHGKDCGGAFSVQKVDADAAFPLLQELPLIK